MLRHDERDYLAIWIGLRRPDGTCAFRWSDGTKLESRKRFERISPKCCDAKYDCFGAMTAASFGKEFHGKWYAEGIKKNCTTHGLEKEFICEKAAL